MEEKKWHILFKQYMNMIINHPNYKGLAITKNNNGEYSWIATKKSEIGKKRIEWALKKAEEYGYENKAGVFAKIMFEIHPTKRKLCQICGEEMSLEYIYPNHYFIKYLKEKYNYVYNVFDTLYDINKFLSTQNMSEREIKDIYISKLSLDKNKFSLTLDELVKEIEKLCRNGEKNLCGPGAMSNFPDRFDGFHSYNRCCRSNEDKGRSKENLRSYNKDRRAYEYWSDGNIHAANKYMNSQYFQGISADHIGPISLGFIHDPRFIQPMNRGENSSKRDRLDYDDFEKLIYLEEKYEISPVSWFAKKIWSNLKEQYKNRALDLEEARISLKINMNYFMEILWNILEIKDNKGREFLYKKFLLPKYEIFKYDYEIDSDGNILSQKYRDIRDTTQIEFCRFIRVSFDSIYDFHEKENRNNSAEINSETKGKLELLLENIYNNPEDDSTYNMFLELVEFIQDYIINNSFN